MSTNPERLHTEPPTPMHHRPAWEERLHVAAHAESNDPKRGPVIRAMIDALKGTLPESQHDLFQWDDNLAYPEHPGSTLTRPRLVAEMVTDLDIYKKPDLNILEIGAGYGVTTRTMATLAPNAHITTFEADTSVAFESNARLQEYIKKIPDLKRPSIDLKARPFSADSLDTGITFDRILVNAAITEATLRTDIIPHAHEDGCLIVAPLIGPDGKQHVTTFLVLHGKLEVLATGSECTFVPFITTDSSDHAAA